MLGQVFPADKRNVSNRIIDDYRLTAFEVGSHLHAASRRSLFSDRKFSFDLPFQDPSLDLRVFACVRHPVDRLVSLYRDSRERSLLVPQALEMSLPQFLDWACSEGMRSCRFLSQCMFLGATATPEEGLSAILRLLDEQDGKLQLFPSERLYEAVAVLDRTGFFGEAGAIAVSRRALEHQATQFAPNVSSRCEDPALRRLVEGAYAADLELWRAANQRCNPERLSFDQLASRKLGRGIVAMAKSLVNAVRGRFAGNPVPLSPERLTAPHGAKWLFLHIPKAGGTTIQAILKKNFPGRFYDGRGPLDWHPFSADEVDLMIRRAPHIDCFADHKLTANLPKHTEGYELHAISFIRDPVEQITSTYFYNRNVRTLFPETKEKSLQEWLEWCLKEQNRPGYADGQSRFLLAGSSIVSDDPEKARERLTAILEDPRIMVFPLSRLDDVLRYLQAAYPDTFRDCTYERLNVSPRNEKTSTPTKDFLREYTRLDYWLLERAHEKLDQWLARYAPNVSGSSTG